MRVLVDESLPRRFSREPADHDVSTVHAEGWLGLRNGVVLRAALDRGMELSARLNATAVRPGLWKALMIVVFLVWAAPRALACSWITVPHELDPAEQKIDRRRPERPQGSLVRVVRGRGPVHREDGTTSGSTCDVFGTVVLRFRSQPKDDRSPADKLGYRLVQSGGVLPERFEIRPAPQRFYPGFDELFLHWMDGASDEQEPIEFALSIVVVDRAGNESLPSEPIWVRHAGSGSQAKPQTR